MAKSGEGKDLANAAARAENNIGNAISKAREVAIQNSVPVAKKKFNNYHNKRGAVASTALSSTASESLDKKKE